MQIRLSHARINRWLKIALVFLCVSGITTEIVMDMLDGYQFYGFLPLFGLSYEDSLSTWYASVILLLCAVALAIIARSKQTSGEEYARHWKALAIIFVYISLDEAISIHELLNSFFHFPGYLYFGWVVPAGIATAVFAAVYLRFLTHLPMRTRIGFVLAGVTYVGGAIGVELLLGKWTYHHGERNLTYGMIDAVEETLELLGASIFLSTLVGYLAVNTGKLQLRIDSGHPQTS